MRISVPETVILVAMFTMLNYRVLAALVAAEVFLTTVLFQGAGPLLGAAVGAAGGAVVFAVGRSVLGTFELPQGARAGTWLLVASGGAFATLLAFYFVVAGPGGTSRWGSAVAMLVALVVVGVASTKLNRMVAAGTPLAPEEG